MEPMDRSLWALLLGGGGVMAAILAARGKGGEVKPTQGPENVVELAEGTSTEPMAYGPRSEVQPLLDEYAAYLSAQGVNLDWFSVGELTKLRRSGKHALPPRHLWDEMARTIVYVAQPIRAELGAPVRLYNAYRPRWYNELVKGAKNSLHISNAAIDMIPTQYADRERLARIAARFFVAHGDERKLGMGIYNYPNMTGLHVDAMRRKRSTPYASTRRWMNATIMA